LSYELGDSAASLLATGTAITRSVWLSYALVRSPGANLNTRLSYTNNLLEDHVDCTGVTTDRTVNVWKLEFSGERQDDWLGGGTNTLGLAFLGGRVSFDDAKAATLDASTANTVGGFTRATFALSRTQKLNNSVSALMNFNGQWAQKNLDS